MLVYEANHREVCMGTPLAGEPATQAWIGVWTVHWHALMEARADIGVGSVA